MRFFKLSLPGVMRIELDRVEDDRGFFSRVFCANEMSSVGMETDVVQCNNTLTRVAGTVRGLHFQRAPFAETKLIRCIAGAVFDVAVDLRAGSPTFGDWCGLRLDNQSRSMIYIPRGFAHGFQALSPDTELLYFHSASYSKAHEGGVHPLDPVLAVDWPLPVVGLSARDRDLPKLSAVEPIQL